MSNKPTAELISRLRHKEKWAVTPEQAQEFKEWADRLAELEADKVNTINLCGNAVKREIDELMAKPDIAGTPAAELLSVAYDNIALALVDMKPQALQHKEPNDEATER